MDAADPQPAREPRHAPDQRPSSSAVGTSPGPGGDDALVIAERDAHTILVRARQDEHAALELRRRLRIEALATIEPDDRIGSLLDPGENLIAVRDATVVARHPTVGAEAPRVVRLYVTTTRLVLLGSSSWSIPLDQIDELAVAGEQVLVTLVDGQGICLDAGSPRLLRVQIAAVRAGLRT